MAQTPTDICNRALQKLGATPITSMDQDSANARSCKTAYDPVRRSLLRSYTWAFAKARASLPADAEVPLFGRANSFTLPSDFLRGINPDPQYVTNFDDWEREGRKIFTNDRAPLQFRYIKDVKDVSEMDSMFQELFSAMLAFEICEEVTQSNTKKESLREDVKHALAQARKTNAIERTSDEPPVDTWITARLY